MNLPVEPVADEGRPEVEEILDALSGLGTIELLGMTREHLDSVRRDSALFETLRIAHGLLLDLRDEGVLGTFLLLPETEQRNFVRWVGGTDAEELRRSRTATFVAALKASPLGARR